MKPDAPPWAVALTSNLQLHLQGILASTQNCKLTCASFQEETVIGCSLWVPPRSPTLICLGSPSSSASSCWIIYLLNGDALSSHLCSYWINYDRLSMINELIPIICPTVRACVRACFCKCAHVRVCNHCRRQISSIRTAGIHHHLPLTFLIAIDLFAAHKYLCWNSLPPKFARARALTHAQTCFATQTDSVISFFCCFAHYPLD